MTNSSPSDTDKILRLVGAIVLASQDAERYLKITLPFIGSQVPGTTLDRLKKLEKRTLGELTGKLVDSSTSDSLDFAQHLAYLVATRNQIVHHFNETYGAQISSGAHREVISSLEALFSNLKGFCSMLEQLALVVLEGLRDITFHGTPEYKQFAELCASFRLRVAN